MKDAEEVSGSNHKSKTPLLISLLVLGSLTGSYFLIPSFQDFSNEAFRVLASGDRNYTRQWVEQFGLWGPVVLILAQIVQMFLFIVPTILIMIVSILAYGPWLGSLIALIGIVTASIIAYIIGRSASNPLLNKLLGAGTRAKMVEYVNKYGAWLVVIARVNPILSNDAVSFVSGIVRLHFIKFMVATVLATIPLLALISYIGADDQRLKNGMYWISGITLVLAIVYYSYKYYIRNKRPGNRSSQL